MPAVGSNSPQARSGGAWKGWSNFWARHAGTWKKPLSVFARRNGVWVKVWDERPSISNVTTSFNYNAGGSGEPPSTTYFKSFTVNANGFQTNITSNDPTGFGVSISQTVIGAGVTTTVFTETYDLGSPNPSFYPTITASNASGTVVF